MTAAISHKPAAYRARGRCFLLSAVLLLMGPTLVSADEDDAERLEPFYYRPDVQMREAVQQTLERARNEEKLAIIALGAEWCHDSRALGSRFSEPSMQQILGDHYATLFVDVGYLADRRDITEPLGYPINFGTPTVLIIDPETGGLVNFAEVSMWQSADTVSLEEYEAYFSGLAMNWKTGEVSPLTEPASEALQAFTDRNVERLMAAYTLLGPLLADYDEDRLESAEAFETLWVEVREFRSQLQQDLTTLRLAEAGSVDSGLEWPEYGPFSWEQSAPTDQALTD